MKIYIGPYENWIGPYQIAGMILFWKDKHEDESVHKFGAWLANNKNGEPTLLARACQWIHSKKKRKIKIEIHPYDTWSVDSTLSLIIVPLLKQLRINKHGSPYVDDEDVPKHLRMTAREKKVFNEGSWNKRLKATEDEREAAQKKFHDRWDWVMSEMIWAFEQLEGDEKYSNYYDPYEPGEKIKKGSSWLGADGERKYLLSEDEARRMGKFNTNKYKAYQERIKNGTILFGKYYRALWD